MPDVSTPRSSPSPDERTSDPPRSDPAWWTPSRRRLRTWLENKAPALAELYESAVIELERQQLPGRSRIIAHCVREIANTLPQILAHVERTRLEYDKELDIIASAWDRLPPSSAPIPPPATGEIPEPFEALTEELASLVDSLVKKHKDSRTKSLAVAERLFSADRPENRHLGNALVPVIRQWVDVKNWFVGRCHENKKDADCDWDEFKKQFGLFERTILTLGQGFFETIAELDELIRTATPDQVDIVISQLGHFEHYRYFFERLEDPAWIPAFQSKRIFRRPPPIERGVMPRWAVSEYLVRVADRSPHPAIVIEVVLEIASVLLNETNPNPFVIRDLICVSVKLPVDQAVKLLPSVKKWVYLSDGVLFWRHLATYANYLVEHGRGTEALSLLSLMLAVERPTRGTPGATIYSSVQSRIRLYDYKNIIEKCLPSMLRFTPRPTLNLLCNVLGHVARLSRRAHGLDQWDDNSSVWYPNFTEVDKEERADARSSLVSATRQAAEYLINEAHQDVRVLVEELESRQWLVLRRLALYVLKSCISSHPEAVTARLTKEELFHQTGIRTEYDLLLEAGFANLGQPDKMMILGWVDTGPPDLSERVTRWTERTGTQPTHEDIALYRRRWQWNRLAPCRNGLPTEWRERYSALSEEFGHPLSSPTRIEARTVSETEQSPISEEQLGAFTVEQLRDYLVSWHPDREHQHFPRLSPSGLSEVLTSVVTKNPQLYGSALDQLKGLDPTYIHGVIRGFTKSVQTGLEIPWDKVLDLCGWVLQQPRDIPGREVDRWEADSDWSGTRWWIVELLRVGIQHGTLAIPLNLREKTWGILEKLTEDPDPEPADEEDDVGRPNGSMNRAINSIRGRAIESLMFYPGWIKHQSGDTRPVVLLPEMRSVLERHLRPEQDSSLAIRSLYGRWFPWMHVLDGDWAAQALPQIFSGSDTSYWSVAWDGFICFNEAYDDVFEILQPIYRRAVLELRSVLDPNDDTRHLRDERLACHLMSFYWRGRYPLEEDQGLIHQFFSIASDRIRAEAIEFIGRSLAKIQGPIDSTVLDRIEHLLARRFQYTSLDPDANQAELKAFGWCFGSGKFDRGLAITRLRDVLRLTRRINPDFLVLESLPQYVPDFPNEVLECISLLIEGQRSHVEVVSWEEDLRRVLSQTQGHQLLIVRRATNRIIEQLGRLGYVEYRDLLFNEE